MRLSSIPHILFNLCVLALILLQRHPDNTLLIEHYMGLKIAALLCVMMLATQAGILALAIYDHIHDDDDDWF